VLTFEVVGQFEDSGRDTELLTGVFGARTRTARLKLGNEILELTEFLAPRGRPYPADTRGNDQWFQHVALIVSDMAAAYQRLRAHGVVHASTGPQRLPDWNPDAGGIQAFYFRDPDGHFLEVLEFPPGKGEDRWQAKDRLFLGLDHTAIVSTDTGRSLRFYRDGLGLAVAGGAENHGVEQEHLNNVFGVRLRITTLRAPTGPGVELLEYLAPRTGRPTPIDLAAADAAHWQTTIAVPAAERFLHDLFGGWLISPTVVTATPSRSFARGLLVRDPDAHGVRLVER
jgi:catechol 2,3-dioxygenase-like lactoylglutathione lyase family enzyme